LSATWFTALGTKLHPKTTVVSGVLEKEATHLMQDFIPPNDQKNEIRAKKKVFKSVLQ
jgi:hypothetical protein